MLTTCLWNSLAIAIFLLCGLYEEICRAMFGLSEVSKPLFEWQNYIAEKYKRLVFLPTQIAQSVCTTNATTMIDPQTVAMCCMAALILLLLVTSRYRATPRYITAMLMIAYASTFFLSYLALSYLLLLVYILVRFPSGFLVNFLACIKSTHGESITTCFWTNMTQVA